MKKLLAGWGLTVKSAFPLNLGTWLRFTTRYFLFGRVWHTCAWVDVDFDVGDRINKL